jgi:hypothetical protein
MRGLAEDFKVNGKMTELTVGSCVSLELGSAIWKGMEIRSRTIQ